MRLNHVISGVYYLNLLISYWVTSWFSQKLKSENFTSEKHFVLGTMLQQRFCEKRLVFATQFTPPPFLSVTCTPTEGIAAEEFIIPNWYIASYSTTKYMRNINNKVDNYIPKTKQRIINPRLTNAYDHWLTTNKVLVICHLPNKSDPLNY